jgi:hypothetical protein
MPAAIAFFLGIFSMGFQLLGSRLLGPWFGSSIVVWAFLISVFLAGFAGGSLTGGLLVRRGGVWRTRGRAVAAGVAVGTLAANALGARAFLAAVDAWAPPVPVALAVCCLVLFFPPVAALSALTPELVQQVSERGQSAGFASGWIYCVGTLGNISGIMLTTFLLIPMLPVSALLGLWAAGVAVTAGILLRCARV